MNDDPLNDKSGNPLASDPRPRSTKKPTVQFTREWGELQAIWRQCQELAPDTEVSPNEIRRFLVTLTREVEIAIGSGPRPLERLKEHLRRQPKHLSPAEVPSTPEHNSSLPSQAAETALPTFSQPVPSRPWSSGNANRPLRPSHRVSEPPAPSAPAIDAQESSVNSIVLEVSNILQTELRQLLERHIRPIGEQLRETTQVVTNAVNRSVVLGQREQWDALLTQVEAAHHRLDYLVHNEAESRQTILTSLADVSLALRGTQQGIESVETRLDRRVDLTDAQQVVQLGRELEQATQSAFIRKASMAITPALDVLAEALVAGDLTAAEQAVAMLRKRCASVGLITDARQLF